MQQTQEKIKCQLSSFSAGGTCAITAIIPFKNLDVDEQFDEQNEFRKRFYKKQLSGRVILGDDMPEQKKLFKGQVVLEGPFTTHLPKIKPTESISMRLTFANDSVGELSGKQILSINKADAWLIVDDMEEVKDDPADNGTQQLWESRPTAELGLDNGLVKKMFDAGVKSIGRVVNIVNGDDSEFDSLTDVPGIAKGRAQTIVSKLEPWFKSNGFECPELSAAD